jgi:hypothetical protein
MKVIGRELKIKFADIGKFSILPMNRELDPPHVQKMLKSANLMGVIRPITACRTNIIDGIMKLYIIDGQHLATSLASLNMEIPYIVIDVEDEKDLIHKMAYLNNSSKSWALLDYVNAFKMIYADYGKLIKFKNMYNIEPLMLAMISMNCSLTASSKLIKSGEFKITNPNTEDMCKLFNDFFIKIGSADRWVKHYFLNVFMKAYGTYNHATALTNLDKHLKTIKAMSDVTIAEQYIAKNIFNIVI